MKSVFTTGEAAKICKVSQQTLIRCFDNGSLKGFRVPGSKFRRIPRENLFGFMRANGIPIDDDMRIRILLVTEDERIEKAMRSALKQNESLSMRMASNAFVAGYSAKESTPDAIVVDCPDGIDPAISIHASLELFSVFERTKLFALTNTLTMFPGIETVVKPFDSALLIERIMTITNDR